MKNTQIMQMICLVIVLNSICIKYHSLSVTQLKGSWMLMNMVLTLL